MRVKYIIDEDFTNYKKPSMFIGTCLCNGKCYKELGLGPEICQNHELMKTGIIDISDKELCDRYLENTLTNAIVFGGLEPFDQFDEVLHIIYILRKAYMCMDDIVIYTGYRWCEIDRYVGRLLEYKNIIIKFGRYIPDSVPRKDEVLGVTLASNNQFAIKIS